MHGHTGGAWDWWSVELGCGRAGGIQGSHEIQKDGGVDQGGNEISEDGSKNEMQYVLVKISIPV